MIPDQGEVAFTFEADSSGNPINIIGYGLPPNGTTFDRAGLRDAFLAANHFHETELDLSIINFGTSKKKREDLNKDPKELLEGYIMGEYKEHEEGDESILLSQAQGLREAIENDAEIRSSWNQVIRGHFLEQEEKRLSLGAKYKPVALKVKPMLDQLSDEFRIERNITGDPLADMPVLSPHPPEFTPTGRYTQERMEHIERVHDQDFLWPEEKKLRHHLMMIQNEAFAWNDLERGRFKPEYFPPVKIPVVSHVPWVFRSTTC